MADVFSSLLRLRQADHEHSCATETEAGGHVADLVLVCGAVVSSGFSQRMCVWFSPDLWRLHQEWMSVVRRFGMLIQYTCLCILKPSLPMLRPIYLISMICQEC